jgi:hypothetical protein
VAGNDASVFTGTSWTLFAGIDPNVSANQATFLASVSCASADFCAAVDDQGNALTYNGTTWSAPTDISGGTNLYSVSCPTVNFCLTEGALTTTAGVLWSAFAYDGTSWSALSNPPAPGRGVSCLSSTFCVIAELGDAAEIYNGSSWTTETIDNPTLVPQSVSCPTVSFCVAALENGIAAMYNGTSWTPLDIDGTVELHSVSCPTVNFCVAVDDQGNELTYNGTTWSPPNNIGGQVPLMSVSCATSTFCMAIGNGGSSIAYSVPPNTAVLLPSVGTSLSGTRAILDASASAFNGGTIAKVLFTLTGGSYNQAVIGTATPTLYGYLDLLNTTTVPNGTYTLQSVARDALGFTGYSPGITVTIGNPPPTTVVGLPQNGATLSGEQWFDASASASDGGKIATVQFVLTGGSYNQTVIGTATPTLYGYLFGLNTAITIPNGTYTLQSLATDAGGNTAYSPGVTITVSNPPPSPPSTDVGMPKSGSTITGAQWFDAAASPGVSSVEYEITGGTLAHVVMGTATPTYVGWLFLWNSTTVPDGTYTVQSVASYPVGISGTSGPITITVAN